MYWIKLQDLVINLDKITSITKSEYNGKYRINFWANELEMPYFVEYNDEKLRDKNYTDLVHSISKFDGRNTIWC